MFEFRMRAKGFPQFITHVQSKAPAPVKSNPMNYKMNFSNMFDNITNVKAGCGKCRGTY